VSDTLDLMNPEAVARLRHALRTPLNHLIGYAEMVRAEAKDQGARAEKALMDQVLSIARQIVDRLQQALPTKSHIPEDALPELRAVMRPAVERVDQVLTEFDEMTGRACAKEVGKMRNATRDLLSFARGADPAAPPGAVPFNAQRSVRPAGPGGRILVVDDDADNREILVRRLEREGFTAVAEANGPSALERLGREPFDLVLLDIFMPGMDGFQVLERMKARYELQDIPVIVLSALDDQANAVRSIEMGADDFVAKPFDPVVLRARIGAILRRRRAEAERAEIAESLQLLLESTGEGVFGEDRQGRCAFVNRAAAEMLGHPRDALLGRDLHSAVHHSRADGSPYPAEACPIHAVLRTGEPRRGRDELLFRADGSSFPIEFSANPIKRDGRTEGVVVTFTDITEKRRSEENLLQSAKLESLGVLAGGIAHDFNNILTGILGNTSLVLESLPEGDDGNRGLLTEVITAGERAADLTRQMLAFAGKGQFVLEPVDLSRAIREVSELLAATLPKPVRLNLQLASSLPPVQADPRQIQQLVFNLVLNAGEAIGDRAGIITIETGVRDLPRGAPAEPPFGRVAPGRYSFAAVQDTGAGMDPATRARIFDPFFSTKFTGRGLGLAAAMGIARAHHGIIRVETAPGRGSRFEFLAPVSRAQAIQMPAASTDVIVARTILVVDDEEIVRRTTQSVLERRGYRVLLAENGQQAVEIFREVSDEISLVLLDLTMPIMGGEEAARFLHAIRHDIPILVSSGYNENEVARKFTGSRVAGYVRKPYTAGVLLDRIKAIVG
jgi:PAS domain S-box-containing protein